MQICNICDSKEFTKFGSREHAKCKGCDSLERHRAMYWYMQENGWLCADSLGKAKILHLAPEKSLSQCLGKLSSGYMACDADPGRYPHTKCFKIELPQDFEIFPDDYYDLVIHNHVLEHISGDFRSHVIELMRILRDDGRMIFTVPMRGIPVTIQYGELLGSDEERVAKFGNRMHFKTFGLDIISIFRLFRYKFDIVTVPPDIAEKHNAACKLFVVDGRQGQAANETYW